jgi:hypothetical protein
MGPSLLNCDLPPRGDPNGQMAGARSDAQLCDQEMNEEIEFAAYTARRVMMLLVTKFETIFAQRKEPWYQAKDDEDVPK